ANLGFPINILLSMPCGYSSLSPFPPNSRSQELFPSLSSTYPIIATTGSFTLKVGCLLSSPRHREPSRRSGPRTPRECQTNLVPFSDTFPAPQPTIFPSTTDQPIWYGVD